MARGDLAASRQRTSDMLFDSLTADAEFVGDAPVGHAAQPVHQEDAPGLSGQGAKRPPIDASQFFSLELPLLLGRSEEHTSELQSLMRISYAVFCLKKTQ